MAVCSVVEGMLGKSSVGEFGQGTSLVLKGRLGDNIGNEGKAKSKA